MSEKHFVGFKIKIPIITNDRKTKLQTTSDTIFLNKMNISIFSYYL